MYLVVEGLIDPVTSSAAPRKKPVLALLLLVLSCLLLSCLVYYLFHIILVEQLINTCIFYKWYASSHPIIASSHSIIFQLLTLEYHQSSILRQIVAGPRQQHPEAGLDLCYVTDNGSTLTNSTPKLGLLLT